MPRPRRTSPPLPSACSDCAPYGGFWRRSANGGLTRCNCARGRELIERTRARHGRKRKLVAARANAAAGKD